MIIVDLMAETHPQTDDTDVEGSGERIDERETALVRRRYDRLARIYDALQWPMERRAHRWRRQIWEQVKGPEVLEVGAGTGANFEFYRPQLEVTTTDVAPKMLEQARRRAEKLDIEATIEIADAQQLQYPDDRFDTVVATFVFCSVPDPLRGLDELHRVLKPGGQLLMLEHVLTEKPVLRWLMRLVDPLVARVWGAHIARETVDNVRRAGFEEVVDTDLSLDIVKRIEARGQDKRH